MQVPLPVDFCVIWQSDLPMYELEYSAMFKLLESHGNSSTQSHCLVFDVVSD